ncbi:hypothetical protein BGZ63DRAFT_421761 [Mariannaea sp. PMI_226]|nr:hypothetical protein BGZ63DRAFT_421761 [Mariannaea sp. PMI_226]
MSHLLWKYFWENDVDKFRRLLAPTGYNTHNVSKSPAIGGNSLLAGSPGGLGTSPRSVTKQRRVSGHPQTPGKSRDTTSNLGRAEVNSRDHAGLTLLLRAASSTNPNARDFVQALIDHPAIDLYAQDPESGWNALHRSLYTGNVSIARLLLDKERMDLMNYNLSSVNKVGQLIKTKDHEGNSPFDLYNSTIAVRSLKTIEEAADSDLDSDSGESADGLNQASKALHGPLTSIHGDELYMFGSNKNISLGVGDEDDRQYPERIHLHRPDHLVRRFYHSYLAKHDLEESLPPTELDEIPTLVQNPPLVIQDVAMSKLHSAILTTDPVCNLYICGVGRGGRLGLGDENTQFKFVPVQGPFVDRKVHQIALGQNHTMAVAGNGELWTWGLNSNSQLGYALPPPMKADEEPMSLSPRQVFGSLKKENIIGVAASANHSVAHTGTSLYTWGRNVGQLALMDADSRSLDVQHTPRKVAASLLASPIEMVSAIDKATSCLLSNHSVWVFSHYGYNLVKFPYPDVFSNHTLTASSFSNRYDPGRREINYITSGGETIAAVTTRGDLFTIHLNQKADQNQSAVSTTNPVKIKNALTQPDCIWDSRKDGVASVGVGEHGSVIICTESGAVWKRVKRVKAKYATLTDSTDARRRDFKFQRVPCITDCVAVRSSIFGAFAAIRSDSNVMSEEITIDEKTLWDDVGSLLCLEDFEATEPSNNGSEVQKAWDAAIVREKCGSVPYQILRSHDIEADLQQWLQMNAFLFEDLDIEICTSFLPEIRIPAHGWVVAGRSPVFREAFSEFRLQGSPVETEAFRIEASEDKTLVTFFETDIYTVLNITVYCYQDKIIPVWKYTREAPSKAFRFRQVRTELMKVASRLSMPKLEAAVRLQASVEASLDADFKQASSHANFFDDGDIIIELDGDEVTAHSQLLCQRCPFFQGMFNGRSQGQWLAGRRDELDFVDKVRVDLKHIDPETFQYVMLYLYADVGQELFEDVTAPTIDEFSELVVDVMSAANELMLDRLSQICQFFIGKFVTTRNIANLLNEISPCAVTEFKDAGLEYICLQLESMLENHLLDELDEDLLLELDGVVRDNQLARFPFVRSGRAELLLHENNPELAGDMEEERRLRVKEMAFKVAQKEDEKKLSSSYKARATGFDDFVSAQAQTPDTFRRKSRAGRNEPFSPTIRPKHSQADLIFDMDEEDVPFLNSPSSPLRQPIDPRLSIDGNEISQLPKAWRQPKGKDVVSTAHGSPLESFSLSPDLKATQIKEARTQDSTISKSASPWASAALTSKLDLRDIMSETSSTSTLTAGLREQRSKEIASNKPQQAKVSQKERKKQLQMQAAAQAAAKEEISNHVPWEKSSTTDRSPAWKLASPQPRVSLKEAMAMKSNSPGAVPTNAKPSVAPEARLKSATRRTASPDTRFSGQGRMDSSSAAASGSTTKQVKKPLMPHSRSYITPAPKAESTVGLSMEDIIGQQKREQERVKEAVAKRSLHDIQQEQAFQEWWDQESRRTQEEEARRLEKSKDRDADSANKGPRRGGRRSRGGKAKSAGGEPMKDGQAGVGAGAGSGAGAGAGGSGLTGKSAKRSSGPSTRGGNAPGRGRSVRGRGGKTREAEVK